MQMLRLPIHKNKNLKDPSVVTVFQVSFVKELPSTTGDVSNETIKHTTLAIMYQFEIKD